MGGGGAWKWRGIFIRINGRWEFVGGIQGEKESVVGIIDQGRGEFVTAIIGEGEFVTG